tara:strand:+ start:2875 stop:3501 length:627 start_codon:yes stop_codon:yes gene_type:complete
MLDISKILTHPVPHIRIENVFPENIFNQLVEMTKLPLRHDLQIGGGERPLVKTDLWYPEPTGFHENQIASVRMEAEKHFVKQVFDRRLEIGNSLGYDLSEIVFDVPRTTIQGYKNEINDGVYRIHQDISWKVLTSIVYISPEVNNGTRFYSNEQGDDMYEDPWKPNCGYIFCRTENSWHNFVNTSSDIRWVVMFNAKKLDSDTLQSHK